MLSMAGGLLVGTGMGDRGTGGGGQGQGDGGAEGQVDCLPAASWSLAGFTFAQFFLLFKSFLSAWLCWAHNYLNKRSFN